MENFAELIYIEKAQLHTYKNAHLPLVKRVEIVKTNPNITGKIFLACCKFVYTHFNLSDNTIAEILNLAEDFLYHNKPADFNQIYNQNKNYLEAFPEEPYSGIGVACLALCKTIGCNAENILKIENYTGEEDNAFDPEDWFVDFLLSNTFSGGNPFLGKGNAEKRTEFWNKYFDLALKIYHSPEVPQSPKIIIETENHSVIIQRTKDFKNEFITEALKKVIELILADFEKSSPNVNWKKIEIEGQNIGALGMIGFYTDDNNEKDRIKLTYYLYKDDQSSVKLMQKIKENIYQQSPQEGTWFSYKMLITPDRSFTIDYNFDEFKIYEGKEPDKEDFIDEFKKYPRAKNFVPDWWQNIIKKHKLEYLD
ncbi:Imm5 family immunity protein [Elizabethkingia anophelis]|uniref:Imm5 family immunity protein n=1 Tax=Elizabethkingia anophelis TaxID=1117645 RepID=UPI00301D43D6